MGDAAVEDWHDLQGRREALYVARLARLKLLPQQHLRITVLTSLTAALTYGAATEYDISSCTQKTVRNVINTALNTANPRVCEELAGTLLFKGQLVLPTWASVFESLRAWIYVANTGAGALAAGAFYQYIDSPGHCRFVDKISQCLRAMHWQWPAPFTWTTPGGVTIALQVGPTVEQVGADLRQLPAVTTQEFRDAFSARKQNLTQFNRHVQHELRKTWRHMLWQKVATRRRDCSGLEEFDYAEHRHYLQHLSPDVSRAAAFLLTGATLTGSRMQRRTVDHTRCLWCGACTPDDELHRFYHCDAHRDI